MLALALVLEGEDRTSAARTCGMDRQTLRDWVHRYNAEGLPGLVNRRARDLIPSRTGWCAGSAKTSSTGSGQISGSRRTSGPSANI